MREKYVDERYPRAMVFGGRPDGTVDISTANGDTIGSTPNRVIAERIVKAYNEMQDVVVRMALAFDEAAPDAFSKFWYETALLIGKRPH